MLKALYLPRDGRGFEPRTSANACGHVCRPGQTSPEVQNRGISGSKVLQNFSKKRKNARHVIFLPTICGTGFFLLETVTLPHKEMRSLENREKYVEISHEFQTLILHGKIFKASQNLPNWRIKRGARDAPPGPKFHAVFGIGQIVC